MLWTNSPSLYRYNILSNLDSRVRFSKYWMPGSRKFSLYFNENLSRHLLSLLDFYVNYKESIVLPDILWKCFSVRVTNNIKSVDSAEDFLQPSVFVTLQLRDANSFSYTVSKLIKISLYAQARQLPLLQAQSSV